MADSDTKKDKLELYIMDETYRESMKDTAPKDR